MALSPDSLKLLRSHLEALVALRVRFEGDEGEAAEATKQRLDSRIEEVKTDLRKAVSE